MVEPPPREPATGWLARTFQSQLFKFLVVGGLGFLVDAGIALAATQLGMDKLTARAISLAVTVTFTWLLNRTLTFETGRPPSWREYGDYVLASLVALGINYLVYFIATRLGVALLGAIALGTICGAAFNFARYRIILRAS